MGKRRLKDPPPIITWISTIIGILGTPIFVIIQWLSDDKMLTIIVGIIIVAVVIVVSTFIFQKQKYTNQTNMVIKNRDLEEIRKELEAKIKELEEKDNQINELGNRIKACKTAVIDTKNLTPLDYYLIDKDVYDRFKSNLRVLECCLEVELIKLHENSEKYNLQFCWRLVVKNCGSEPADKANFIYSGEKDIDSNLNITTEKVTYDNYETRPDIKVLGDDRFIEINFADEIAVGNSAVIHIDYVFEKYKFNRERDRIWLVPDALGFAGMDEFCIVFYCDGEIVHKETKVELKSYKLKGEYNLERMRRINFSDPNNKKGKFQAKSRKKEELYGHGYVLELSNDKAV